MLVKNKINDKIYCDLVQFAIKKCDAVMFVFRKDGLKGDQIRMLNNSLAQMKLNFNPFLYKRRNGSHWVFTKVGYSRLGITNFNDADNFDDLFEILFYRTNEKITQYLLTNQNLYSWLNPEYPEDISFFKNGYCWLYSVAHEEFCEIYCESEEEYEYLKSIGIEFEEDQYIPTPKEELYYENYNNEE